MKDHSPFTDYPDLVSQRGGATYSNRHGILQVFNGYDENLWQFKADEASEWEDIARAECQLDNPGEIAARCTDCGHEIDRETMDTANLSHCPACYSKGKPCDPANDVTIKINWHELRVLVIWAEQWANHALQDDPQTFRLPGVIASRIEAQCPEMARKTPLTFLGEIKQLKKSYGGVEQNVVIDPDDLIIPPMD